MEIAFLFSIVYLVVVIIIALWVLKTMNNIVSELNKSCLLQQKIAEKLGVAPDDIDFAIGKKQPSLMS